MQERVFSCHDCQRQYSSKTTLKRHQNTHTRKEVYLCQSCGLRFYRLDLLRRHSRIHTTLACGKGERDRQRICLACDRCRCCKLKCDGTLPCISCQKSNNLCNYSYRPARPSKQSASIRATESQLSGEAGTDMSFDHQLSPPNLSILPTVSGLEEEPPSDAMTYSTLLNNEDLVYANAAISETYADLNLVGLDMSSDLVFTGKTAGSTSSVDNDMNKMLPTRSWDWLSSPMFAVQTEQVASTYTLRTDVTSQDDCSEIVNDQPDSNQLKSISRLEIMCSTLLNQDIVVKEHVEYALQNPRFAPAARLRRWKARFTASTTAIGAFCLGSLQPNLQNRRTVLDQLLDLFFQHFHPLHPILWQQGFDSYTTSPVLILSMATIGGAFAGPDVVYYVTKLHDRLMCLFEECLSASLVRQLDLGGLLLGFLVLSAELLLNPKSSHWKAYNICMRLQSRAKEIGLFDRERRKALSLDSCVSDSGVAHDEELRQWINEEIKKRLLLEIIQVDSIVSQGLNSSPTICHEKVDLDMPCAYETWVYTGHDWHGRILEASMQDKSMPDLRA